MKLSMKHSMDFRAHHVHPHPMVFAYVFLTFATFPSNLMESIKGGGLPLLLWRRPKAASIKLDGNVANVRKTYANTYQILVHLDISWILLYFPYVFPGAIYLARYSTPLPCFWRWMRGAYRFRKAFISQHDSKLQALQNIIGI